MKFIPRFWSTQLCRVLRLFFEMECELCKSLHFDFDKGVLILTPRNLIILEIKTKKPGFDCQSLHKNSKSCESHLE